MEETKQETLVAEAKLISSGAKAESRKLRLKCSYQENLRAVLVHKGFKFSDLKKRLEQDFGFEVMLQYRDEDGDLVLLASQDDLDDLFGYMEEMHPATSKFHVGDTVQVSQDSEEARGDRGRILAYQGQGNYSLALNNLNQKKTINERLLRRVSDNSEDSTGRLDNGSLIVSRRQRSLNVYVTVTKVERSQYQTLSRGSSIEQDVESKEEGLRIGLTKALPKDGFGDVARVPPRYSQKSLNSLKKSFRTFGEEGNEDQGEQCLDSMAATFVRTNDASHDFGSMQYRGPSTFSYSITQDEDPKDSNSMTPTGLRPSNHGPTLLVTESGRHLQRGELLGRGAFGAVYLTLSMDNGQLMALKEMHLDMTTKAP
eukprot:CAMPEP_0117738480 /NCGR_PEP_ID=MMETSP0947-20121206/3155_1 /TAXON_ID=44440 /ORGANISM="Chattonella subsalsa, Strain CCMP2191" /LENGTH=369 /DNA_ID=CAMNT_0005554179 /DNA_START=359 /DNA_END=1468 /DNA_ORIENTATION=-